MANSFHESFDNGAGALTNVWGNGVDTGVKGQITLNGSSGGAGHGYGRYTVTAEVEGNAVGPAALLWPSDDRWPGTEIDFVEVLPNGTAYGTAHADKGGNWYEAKTYNVDEGGVHT